MNSSVKFLYQNANDWTNYEGVLVTISNTGDDPLVLLMRADTQRPHGPSQGSVNAMLLIQAGSTRNVVFWFDQTAGQYGYRTGIANFTEPYQFAPRTNNCLPPTSATVSTSYPQHWQP